MNANEVLFPCSYVVQEVRAKGPNTWVLNEAGDSESRLVVSPPVEIPVEPLYASAVGLFTLEVRLDPCNLGQSVYEPGNVGPKVLVPTCVGAAGQKLVASIRHVLAAGDDVNGPGGPRQRVRDGDDFAALCLPITGPQAWPLEGSSIA